MSEPANTPELTKYAFFTAEANAMVETPSVTYDGENAVSMTFANSVLNTLNRWIPDRQSGNFWPLEAFEPVVNSWNGCPIVFQRAGEHLNPLNPDFEAELKRVGGRVVGYANNSRIVKEGHPRQMAALPVADAESIKLYKEGKLGISSAFTALRNAQRRIIGGVVPHHILLFEENEHNQQRDKSAIVCSEGYQMFQELDTAVSNLKAAVTTSTQTAQVTNTSQLNSHSHYVQVPVHQHTYDANTTGGVYVGSGWTGVPQQAPAVAPAPVIAPAAPVVPVVNVDASTKQGDDSMAETEKIQELNKEIEAKVELVASLNKEVETLKADVATKIAEVNAVKEQLEAKDKIIAGYAKAEKDAKYAAFKNTVKKAFYDTPEKDAALRNRFENDLPNLVMEMNTMLIAGVPTKETGAEAVVAEQNAEAEVHGAGEFDPITRQWK